jgi:2-polyprenyl-3-methyl-5-hydroxy-6-metoxy-1,4-benzoquinol methylase
MARQRMTNRDEIRQHYTTQTNSGAMDSYTFGNTLLSAIEARVVSTSSNLDNASILDVGCGAGFLISRMGARSQGKVIGIDLTQACVDQANRNVQNARLPNNSNGERVRALCQDVRALRKTDMTALRRETPNGQGFDFIFAITLFQHIPQGEHAEVSNQLVRLLRHGGRLFLHLQGHSTSCFAHMVGTVFVTTDPAPDAQVQRPLLLPPVFNAPSHGQLQPITVVAPLWPASEAQRIDQDARSFASTLTQSVDVLTTYDLTGLFAGLMPTYEDVNSGQACQQLIRHLQDETGRKNLSDGDLWRQFFDIGGANHQIACAVMPRMEEWYNAQVVDARVVACLSGGRLLRALNPHVHWVTSDILLDLKRR